MKKILCISAALLLLVSLSSCNNSTQSPGETDEYGHDIADGHTHGDEPITDEYGHDVSDGHTHLHIEAPAVIDSALRETVNADEYKAYHDLFFNSNAGAYENKEFTKYGTFAIIFDAYHDCTRYYVWGYGDENKGSCYQWEFVMPEGTVIPAAGSYIRVSGTMTYSEEALDKYILTDVTLSVEEEYTPSSADYDFVTMSPTLGRVQQQNMTGKEDQFKNVTVRMPVYINDSGSLSSVFEFEAWALHYKDSSSAVKVEDYMIIDGVFNETGTDSMIKIISAQSIG